MDMQHNYKAFRTGLSFQEIYQYLWNEVNQGKRVHIDRTYGFRQVAWTNKAQDVRDQILAEYDS